MGVDQVVHAMQLIVQLLVGFRGADGRTIGGNRFLPITHAGKDVRRHVQPVRRRGGDFGITLCRFEPLIRDRRIIVGVNQVMSDAGVIRLALEDRLQDRCGLELVRIGLVCRRRCHVQRQGIIHLRFVVVRIALRQLLHHLHIGLDARAVVGLVVAAVKTASASM